MSKKIIIAIVSVVLVLFIGGIFTLSYIFYETEVFDDIKSLFSSKDETNDDFKNSSDEDDETANVSHENKLSELKGGIKAVLTVDDSTITKAQLNDIAEQLRIRLDSLGFYEATVTAKKSDKIILRMPETENPEETISVLCSTAQLKFVDADGDVILTGDDVKTASAEYGAVAQDGTKQYYVSLTFKPEGVDKFTEATARAASRVSEGANCIAIMIDDVLISAPNVYETINSETCIITGDFDAESAKALAGNIRSGQLNYKLTIDSIKLIE